MAINGKGIFEENDLYDINLGVENLKIETCSKNTKSIQYRHGEIILKGYFTPQYTIGGQGYNFLLLRSTEL